MDADKQLQDFFLRGDQIYMPHLSVDCVIFGFHDNHLKVLLLKWKKGGQWCLPGGFVKYAESVDDSAVRILKERTGIDNIFLQQFHTFGDPKREKGKSLKVAEKKSWIHKRFVSVGYYALVEYSKVNPQPDIMSIECRWWDINTVPTLIYDHNKMIEKALQILRLDLNDHPLGYNLLPEKFTMPELQRLYETILDEELDRRNFQKRMLGLGILERLKERKTGGAHKAPYLYRFDKKKYDKAMKQGLSGGW
ncbi:MAG: NUDIX domain-containing protein [Cyclobacteriaceae bacterium]|nr:NUDIX domain-containing protein [Cyclobacteriaceae bacterium]